MRIEKLRSIRSRAVFVALFLALGEAQSPTVVVAGVNAWTPIGPEGGNLCALAVAPSEPATVYAAGITFGDGSTLFRSADNGVTWESTGTLVQRSTCFFSVDSGDPRRLYLLDFGSLRRSVDGGVTWAPSDAGLPYLYPGSRVAVDPHDPSFLLIASDGAVYRSRDRGDSWQQIWQVAGQPIVDVQSVVIHPAFVGRIYALTYGDGMFVSADFGDTWASASQGLPPTFVPKGLAFDPLNAALLYVQGDFGVYRSRDGGRSWTSVLAGSGALDRVQHLAVTASSAVYVRRLAPNGRQTLRSSDAGETWQELANPPSSDPNFEFSDLAATPGALLATSTLGVARSIDDGTTWQTANSGMFGTVVSSLMQDRQDPQKIYGVDYFRLASNGILRSWDRGATWQVLEVSTAAGRPYLHDLLIDPDNPDHLLVAVSGAPGFALSGVATSQDAGETWSAQPGPFDCLYLVEFVLDPLEPSRLFWLGTPKLPACGLECTAHVSQDSGASWECVHSIAPADRLVHIAPSPYRRGVALALAASGIYRSTNAGLDWELVAGAPDYDPGYPDDIEWAGADTVYATSRESGLYVSQDAGLTWAQVSSSPAFPWIAEIVVDPMHPSSLYALARSGFNVSATNVVRSRDAGLTWEELSTGLQGWNLDSLTIDPVTPNRLLVSAAGGGVLAYDVLEPEPCVASATALCITGDRFRVESRWRDFAGHSGAGHAVPLSGDTGGFWFFDPDNLELFVKEIDGQDYNNAFWSFYGALSNVEFTVLATDTATGAQRGYFNPSRRFASQGDIDSFPQEEGLALPASGAAQPLTPLRLRATPQRSANACVPSSTTLCLADGRFAASVTWHDFAGRSGVGTPIVLTPDTGSFWFFDAGIHELAVKVIDGRGTNNAWWVFYGSLSNVEFELTVVDTETGDTWTRSNPSGTFASNGDIEAFPQ